MGTHIYGKHIHSRCVLEQSSFPEALVIAFMLREAVTGSQRLGAKSNVRSPRNVEELEACKYVGWSASFFLAEM